MKTTLLCETEPVRAQGSRNRFPRALLLAGITMLALMIGAGQSLFADHRPVKGVWVAFGEDILTLDAGTMSLVQRIPELQNIRRIGLDKERAILWAYGNRILFQFHFGGRLLSAIAVPIPDGEVDDIVRLRVHPEDGTVWLSVGPNLWKFGRQGDLISTFVFPRNIVALSLDPARVRIWIATDKKLYRRHLQTGAEEMDFSPGQEQVRDIDVEIHSGNLWVATDKNIRRYDSTGASRLQKSFKEAVSIASDYRDGIWIATNKKLLRWSSTGKTQVEIQPFSNVEDLGSILSLVSDPGDSSAWAANQNKLLHIDFHGQMLHSVPFRGPLQTSDRIRDLALGPASTESHAPVIAFTAPEAGAVIDTFTPRIELNFSDEDDDILSHSLRLIANGADDLTSYCTIGSGSALCVPVDSLALGTNMLSATIEDAEGNISDAAEVTFTISVREAHPPVIVSTPVLIATAGELYVYDAEATDPDPGDELTFSLTTAPAGMTIDPTSGYVQWTPAQAEVADVELKVTDSAHLFATQAFRITVYASPNRAPFAFDDRYVVRRRKTLDVQPSGVLGNDLDPDNDPLTAVLATSVTRGDFEFSTDGSFTYTPSEPPPGSTEPVLKFSYRDVDTSIVATLTQPLVMDLNQDGAAEIIFNSQGPFGTCKLIAVHGSDGSVYFSVDAHQPGSAAPIVLCDSFSEMAAGDLDGDGSPEILAVDSYDGGNNDIFRRQLIAFNHDGSYRWTGQDLVDDPLIDATGGFAKPVIADITGDGRAEIVVGHCSRGPLTRSGLTCEGYVTVYSHEGQILWTARGGGSAIGASFATPVVADINLDGHPEILFSDDVFDPNGILMWSAAACETCIPRVADTAVANLDGDPFAEIVYVDTSGNLYVHEHTGIRKWGPLAVPGAGSFGPGGLTVGDADGNGIPEILVTGGDHIRVISQDGASMRSIPVPFASGGSGKGNTTIFDLNGDGKPELLHHGMFGPFDAGFTRGALYIFDGETGTHLHSP